MVTEESIAPNPVPAAPVLRSAPVSEGGKFACPHCYQKMEMTPRPHLVEITCPSCKSAFRLQGRIGHYRLERKAGSGGMGVVFQARDEALDRLVAIKMLYEDTTADDRRFQVLLQEARAAAATRHPAVVDIYHFGTAGGHPYLVMEWMPGGSLQDWLKPEHKPTEVQVLDVASSILQGLEKCHANRLVHGDLKPANILFDADGNAKISDFGIAHFRGVSTPSSSHGTPFYVAPEKVKLGQEDLRSDLYGVGAILWHLLAGRPPFNADSVQETIRLRLTQPPPDLRAANPAISPETSQLVKRLMDPEPSSRVYNYQAIRMLLFKARTSAARRATRALTAEPVSPAGAATTGSLRRILTSLWGGKRR